MRDYTHTVDQDFIENRLERFLSRKRDRLWRRIRQEEVGLDYVAGIALQGHFDAVCCAWGLEGDEVLAECRGLLTDLTRVMLGFPREEIHTHIGHGQLNMAGLGDDRNVVVELAESLAGRPHEDSEGITSPAGSHWLADSMASLLTGNDPASREAADKAAAEYASPATPPGSPVASMPDAIRAVIDGDEEALADAAADSIERFAVFNAPSATQRAAPNTLIHASLSVVSRVAGWRGMTTPSSPYIMPMPD